MIKELFLAIALGAILGLGLTGGFFALNKTKGQNNQSTIEVSPTPTISGTQSNQPDPEVSKAKSIINITSPEDNTVVSNSQISIKGDTTPNSLIIVSTPNKTFNSKSNANGVFSVDIELDSGVNPIKINCIDSNDNQNETNLTITYSTAKI